MILDLETSGIPQPDKSDVCILGAGAAGIILALELAQKGQRVLVLEGGGLDLEATSQDIYRSELSGLPHNGIHTGRYRCYGGTTTQWGGQILELFPEDFAARDWIKESGWPFPKETLSGYYARAIEKEGLRDATLSDDDVWQELGLKYPDLGSQFTQYFSRWCPEPNFARLHGAALASAPNLHLYVHANACEFLLGDDDQTISGVRARTLTGKEVVFHANQYVVCLGGIESSRFLLQPHADGRAPWLKNDLLGRHFQDHPAAACGEIIGADTKLFHDCFDNVFTRGYKYQPRFHLNFPEQARERLLNVASAITFTSEVEESLHQMKVIAKQVIKGRWREVKGKDAATLLRHWPLLLKSAYRYKVAHRTYNSPSSKIELGVGCEQEPCGESRITLSSERDKLGLFRARLDWRVSDLEIHTIQSFVRLVQKVFPEKGLGTVVPYEELFTDPAKFISRVGDSNHHMGGARMAASPRDGVVDPDLKIHGTTNAFVCSSAVFPTSGFSNPTHTLLALSLRLADHLTSQ